MKVILSRKGIDDKYGGGFSPVLPDGTMMSIPIPQSKGMGIPYEELTTKGISVLQVIEELGLNVKDSEGKKLRATDYAHLDPDLRPKNDVSHENWKGAFGQAGGAATHLQNEDVKEGDLFLFFGSFRNTDHMGGEINVEPQHTKHVLFGYLQIGEIIQGDDLKRSDILDVYGDHPHVMNAEEYYNPRNILYIASEKLENTHLPGWGTFRYSAKLDLTKPGYKKSIWELPTFFHPENGTTMSFHPDPASFIKRSSSVLLQTVATVQDFVVSESAEVTEWALSLIKDHVIIV